MNLFFHQDFSAKSLQFWSVHLEWIYFSWRHYHHPFFFLFTRLWNLNRSWMKTLSNWTSVVFLSLVLGNWDGNQLFVGHLDGRTWTVPSWSLRTPKGWIRSNNLLLQSHQGPLNWQRSHASYVTEVRHSIPTKVRVIIMSQRLQRSVQFPSHYENWLCSSAVAPRLLHA